MSDTLIYIREAGTQSWTPAEGALVSGDVYRVTRVPPTPPLEFKPGDLVRCAVRAFPDGSEALLALERASGAS